MPAPKQLIRRIAYKPMGMPEDKPYHDKSRLYTDYWEQGLSTRDIANKYNVSYNTVDIYLRRHGIQRRHGGSVGSYVESMKVSEDIGHPSITTIARDGYTMVYGGNQGDRFPLHRLIYVAEHGLDALDPDKIVHHESEIPWDNRPSNLEQMKQSEHVRIHVDGVCKEDILEDIQRAANKVDNRLTKDEYYKLGNHYRDVVEKYFGSFRQAKIEAGVVSTTSITKSTTEDKSAFPEYK